LFIFGGVAQIGREPETAGAEFRIALAGPLTSLALAALFGGLGVVFGSLEPVSAPLTYLGRINLFLALFNMIPGFPLDGGRVLRAVLWARGGSFRHATQWAARVGQVVAVGFILVGAAQILLGAGLFNGLWTAFIGWFLTNAATSSYQQVVLRYTLSGVRASSVMTQQCQTVPGDLPLDRLVEDNFLGQGQRCFFVGERDNLHGLVTVHNIRGVAPDRRGEVTTGQVMTPVDAVYQVHPNDDLMTVLQKMDESDVNQVPVVADGHLVGLITRDTLLHDLKVRAELAI
jgi:CBS domain-containing protein